MAIQSARQTAVEGLLQVSQKGGYSNVVLDRLLKQNGLSVQDGAFASALFYGTLERKLTLNHVISAYSSKPLKSLSPEVAEILRVSLYQLLYLDGVPESAAVNEGVKLTKAMKVTSASGFVNAVLRAFLRDGKKLPPVKGNRMKKWEIRYSCPQWLIKRLLEEYGEEETLAFLEHSLGRSKLFARVNTTRITANDCIVKLNGEGVQAEADPDLADCLILSGTSSVDGLAAFQQGLFHIQDKSSQLCSAALGACPGDTVLDLCGAPGSKAFTIAEGMENQGRVICCDIFPEKVEKIRAGASRLGLDCVTAVQNDASKYNDTIQSARRVLCDVPCSGMGIIGRKPEIKYKDPKELAGLPEVQKTILQTAARYVEPGGTLIYSTCTLLPEENRMVVEAFLDGNPEFEPQALPDAVRGLLKKQDDAVWQATLLPGTVQTDGFYFASLRRKAAH